MSDLQDSLPISPPRSLPNTTSPKLTIFISYVHEDFGIAGALNNVIQNAFGSDVGVFLDKVSIQQGENIHASIDENLANADILAVVCTGIEGPRYWAGYEIGFFEAIHKNPAPANHPLWGNHVIFCSPGNLPGPVGQYKYITLGFDKAALEMNQQEFDAKLKSEDDEPLLLWFGDLLAAISGEKLEQRRKLRDTYKSIIADFRKGVFAEFKRRPKFVFKPQKQLMIRFNSAPKHRFQLGQNAEISLLGNAHTVFGILSQSNSRTLRWEEFTKELAKAEGSLATFWSGTLVRMLARAGIADGVDEVTGNLIWSHNEQKLFRLILTTYTTYYNDSIEASIYIVEVLRRTDRGDPLTSLLAKGLQSAMRFRSLFLEENGLFNYLNVALPGDGLAVVAADIVAELDFLNMDLAEADLQKPASWKGILTAEEIEAMALTWLPLKTRLIQDCNKAMAHEPSTYESAKSDLAATLREIGTRVGPLNDRLLRAVAAKLVEIADQTEAKRAANV